MKRWLWLAGIVGPGCVRPVCTPPDYTQSECRVQAETELARGVASNGVELRFQDWTENSTDGWEATGLVGHTDDGRLTARIGTLGRFRLSVHRNGSPDDVAIIELTNVSPFIQEIDGELSRQGLTRVVQVALTDSVVQIYGVLEPQACDDGFKLAVVGDVQTGAVPFQRLITDLHREAADAAFPLLGLLLLGDLAEDGSADELARVAEVLAGSPVPVAVTPGNHDIYATDQAVFAQQFGAGNYAFDLCDAHIVMLDTGNGDIAESVQGWLPRLLDHDQRFLAVGTHMPPYVAGYANGWRREDQAQHLLVELEERNANAVFAGHIHSRLELNQSLVRQIIVGTGGASQGRSDPEYGYLRAIFADRLRTCFVSLPAPGSAQTLDDRAPRACAN